MKNYFLLIVPIFLTSCSLTALNTSISNSLPRFKATDIDNGSRYRGAALLTGVVTSRELVDNSNSKLLIELDGKLMVTCNGGDTSKVAVGQLATFRGNFVRRSGNVSFDGIYLPYDNVDPSAGYHR
jgi:hypothetical protein